MDLSPNNDLSLAEELLSTEDPAFSVDTCPKRRQQSHTRAQRADFLAAVERLGSVAAAAKLLGINRSNCQKWANAAGMPTLCSL